MLHLHLDAVGGIAGNMFIAAVLDAFPEWAELLAEQISLAGFGELVTVKTETKNDGVLTGTFFEVNPTVKATTDHVHRPYRLICETLTASNLLASVKQHALGIFNVLAEAEARVHGTTAESVEFHEVGAWDSIADVVCAAFLIEQLNTLAVNGQCSWSVSPLPLGRGSVSTAHGVLPVPAPAVTVLLKNFDFVQDELEGERVTPTGAAILKYLVNTPVNNPISNQSLNLQNCGYGFGSKTFPGISNVLRLLVFSQSTNQVAHWYEETVLKVEFEIDDQSAEDISIGIDKLRATPGVLDVCQYPVFAKKGRLATSIQVLALLQTENLIVAECFNQFTTLGLRKQRIQRAVLSREETAVQSEGVDVHIKNARRPNGNLTMKVAADDVAKHADTQSERDLLRQHVQSDNSKKHDK